MNISKTMGEMLDCLATGRGRWAPMAYARQGVGLEVFRSGNYERFFNFRLVDEAEKAGLVRREKLGGRHIITPAGRAMAPRTRRRDGAE